MFDDTKYVIQLLITWFFISETIFFSDDDNNPEKVGSYSFYKLQSQNQREYDNIAKFAIFFVIQFTISKSDKLLLHFADI